MPDGSLLWTIVKNLGPQKVNRDLVGLSVEEHVAPVSPEQAWAFGAATGDPSPVYGIAGGPLPPLYMAKLVIPALKRILQTPGLSLNLLRMVHAEQTIRWHKTLHSDEPLKLSLALTAVRQTDAGELLTISGRCLSGGDVAVEGTTGLLVRSGRSRKPRKKPPDEIPGAELFRIRIRTREGQQLEYARVSGDRNFIHTSELMARAAGLPRTILHGACVMAMACSALTCKLAGGDIESIDGIEGRFSKPAFPGSSLTLIGYEGPTPRHATFSVCDETGAQVIKNGRFYYA